MEPLDGTAEDYFSYDAEDGIDVIDSRNVHEYLTLDESLDDEIDLYDMTSLGAYVLLGRTLKSESHPEYLDEDTKLQRLSLAYERLHSMPKIIIQEVAQTVKILDLSHNEFNDLAFLAQFKQLTTLICDHNPLTAASVIPHMPKLELLWMNHCKLETIYPWAKQLQLMCPNLKHLSLMGNPMAPSYLNGGSFYEHLHYRYFVISLFPRLVHLDDRPVTDHQRATAQRVYYRPLMERLITNTQTAVPKYLKSFSDSLSTFLTPVPPFVVQEKNRVV